MRHVWEDLVDVFRLAKADLEVTRDETTGRIKAARSFASPLDFYHKRGWIDDDQYSAGVDFAELWLLGIERGHHSQWRYEVTAGGQFKSKDVFSDATLRLMKALRAIDEPAGRMTAVRVCCHNRPAGPRKDMATLKRALDDLVKHFRR